MNEKKNTLSILILNVLSYSGKEAKHLLQRHRNVSEMELFLFHAIEQASYSKLIFLINLFTLKSLSQTYVTLNVDKHLKVMKTFTLASA